MILGTFYHNKNETLKICRWQLPFPVIQDKGEGTREPGPGAREVPSCHPSQSKEGVGFEAGGLSMLFPCTTASPEWTV